MRTAAKVFIIIGMIFLFWLIFPIVLGVICLQKLNDPNTPQDEINTWGIVAIFTVSTLGGIFMLLIPIEEKNGGFVDVQSTPKPDSPLNNGTNTANTNSYEYIEKIKELKDLYDSGAITEREFIELKAKLLNK